MKRVLFSLFCTSFLINQVRSEDNLVHGDSIIKHRLQDYAHEQLNKLVGKRSPFFNCYEQVLCYKDYALKAFRNRLQEFENTVPLLCSLYNQFDEDKTREVSEFLKRTIYLACFSEKLKTVGNSVEDRINYLFSKLSCKNLGDDSDELSGVLSIVSGEIGGLVYDTKFARFLGVIPIGFNEDLKAFFGIQDVLLARELLYIPCLKEFEFAEKFRKIDEVSFNLWCLVRIYVLYAYDLIEEKLRACDNCLRVDLKDCSIFTVLAAFLDQLHDQEISYEAIKNAIDDYASSIRLGQHEGFPVIYIGNIMGIILENEKHTLVLVNDVVKKLGLLLNIDDLEQVKNYLKNMNFCQVNFL